MRESSRQTIFAGGMRVTSGDRIRAMSDEELAVTFSCPNEMGMAEIPCDYSDHCNCFKCLLEWLKEEEEDETS